MTNLPFPDFKRRLAAINGIYVTDFRLLMDGGVNRRRRQKIYTRGSNVHRSVTFSFDPPVFTTEVVLQVNQQLPQGLNGLETVSSIAIYRTFGGSIFFH